MKDTYIELKQGKMFYYLEGSGPTIVILHGWGQSYVAFSKITNHLKEKFQVLGVDFLGFGKSDQPNTFLTVENYTEHLQQLLEKLNINNPIIIAHSFGGRIALKYAANNDVESLILIASAGIKHRSFKYYYKVYKYKILKFIFKHLNKEKYEEFIKTSGSADYKSANMIMKQTLSKVVNYNSKSDMKKITTDTYLLWGVYDNQTPYDDCLKMHKLIKNSRIITFYNSSHFLYQDEEKKFFNIIDRLISRNLWKR